MYPNLAATFSEYLLRTIRGGASPLLVRIGGVLAFLVAVPIAIVTVMLTVLGAALLVLTVRLRRQAPAPRSAGPTVIEGEYTVIDEPRAEDGAPARRIDRQR